MHRVYRKRLMRGYLKYLKKHKGEEFFTTTVSYTPSSEICLQGKGRTFQILYRVASWTQLMLGKRKKNRVMEVTPNVDLR